MRMPGTMPSPGGTGDSRGGMRMPGMTGGMGGMAGMRKGGSMGTGSRPNDPGGIGGLDTGDASASKKSGLKRTEFVVIFVWKEPVPSDAIFKVDTPTGDAGGEQPGGAMPGMMPGAGAPAAPGGPASSDRRGGS
jgi:hypothetical protein